MVSASGVCLDVRESISCAGLQPSEGKRKGCKANRKGCKRGLNPKRTYAGVVRSGVCFPSVSPAVIMEEGETHVE